MVAISRGPDGEAIAAPGWEGNLTWSVAHPRGMLAGVADKEDDRITPEAHRWHPCRDAPFIARSAADDPGGCARASLRPLAKGCDPCGIKVPMLLRLVFVVTWLTRLRGLEGYMMLGALSFQQGGSRV